MRKGTVGLTGSILGKEYYVFDSIVHGTWVKSLPSSSYFAKTPKTFSEFQITVDLVTHSRSFMIFKSINPSTRALEDTIA